MRSKIRHLRILLTVGSVAAIGILLLLMWPLARLLQEHGITAGFIRSMMSEENIPVRHRNQRTNILILGNPGGTAEGFDLTDTIVLTSIHVREDDGVLLSVPRDMWIPSLSEKINAAYRGGEEEQPGKGLNAAKMVAEEVLGQPVHYAVRMDFSGFIRIIDLLDGIEITVSHPIDDQFFPIPGRENDLCDADPALGCRYEHLRFDPGLQHMDGTTALKYVRSRQSIGEEGTDFSRSKRQQQVVLAIKTKLLSYFSWEHRARLYSIANELRYATETDMKLSDVLFFFRRLTQISDGNIRRLALDQGDEKTNRPGLLVNPPPQQYFGAWVLIPRSGTFDEIHRYVSCQLEDPNCQFPL